MKHEFKIWPSFYDAVEDGTKPFDVRRLDPVRKPVNVGDSVLFKEWDPEKIVGYLPGPGVVKGAYTGRECQKVVTYVLHGDGALFPFGYFVMGLCKGEPVWQGERIDRCAIRQDDGKIYSLPRPARHPDIIRFMVEECGVPKPVNGTRNGGFISNTGRYYNRVNAFQVAKVADQIVQRQDGVLTEGPELTSEDLW